MADKKENFVVSWWDGLTPTQKMIVVVVSIIIIIILVSWASTKYNEWQLAKYNGRSDLGTTEFRDPRPLVDNIYNKLYGTNWLYVYPEVVNKLANLSEAELSEAVKYWESRYATETGYASLYDFINAEWDGGEYEPALQILRQYGHA